MTGQENAVVDENKCAQLGRHKASHFTKQQQQQ